MVTGCRDTWLSTVSFHKEQGGGFSGEWKCVVLQCRLIMDLIWEQQVERVQAEVAGRSPPAPDNNPLCRYSTTAGEQATGTMTHCPQSLA